MLVHCLLCIFSKLIRDNTSAHKTTFSNSQRKNIKQDTHVYLFFIVYCIYPLSRCGNVDICPLPLYVLYISHTFFPLSVHHKRLLVLVIIHMAALTYSDIMHNKIWYYVIQCILSLCCLSTSISTL